MLQGVRWAKTTMTTKRTASESDGLHDNEQEPNKRLATSWMSSSVTGQSQQPPQQVRLTIPQPTPTGQYTFGANKENAGPWPSFSNLPPLVGSQTTPAKNSQQRQQQQQLEQQQEQQQEEEEPLPPLVPLDAPPSVPRILDTTTTASRTPPAPNVAVALPSSLAYDDEDSEDEELMESLARKFNCDAIRRKIQRFLATKTVTQTAFLKEMNVNSNSFRRFMQFKGPFSGNQNGTYWGALRYFHNHEAQQKKAKARSPGENTKEARARAKAEANELLAKVASVDLPEPVYVFDDCDEVRKKINEVIATKMLTQAALIRELEVNSNSLRRFLSSKGKREGCSNGVYFKAYRFFEKLRIAEGRAKTKKRLNKEAQLPQGYPLKRDPTHFWSIGGKVDYERIAAAKKDMEEGTYWYKQDALKEMLMSDGF